MTEYLNNSGYVLWAVAGAAPKAWQVGKLRVLLQALYPDHSDGKIYRLILHHFIPDAHFRVEVANAGTYEPTATVE